MERRRSDASDETPTEAELRAWRDQIQGETVGDPTNAVTRDREGYANHNFTTDSEEEEAA